MSDVPDCLALVYGSNLGSGIPYRLCLRIILSGICLRILDGLRLDILYRLCRGILYGLCGRDLRPSIFAGRPGLELT
jgi:hypothetical protein